MLTAALSLSALPALAWYGHGWWIARAESPLVSKVFFSLHDSTRVHMFPHPLLLSADFYRKLLDDMTGPALTPLGFCLLLVGLCCPAARRYRIWLAMCGLLVVLLPLKFYRMNYYDLLILPPLAIVAGLGWERILGAFQRSSRTPIAILAVALLLSMRYAFVPAFVTPGEDQSVIPAAEALRKLASPQQRIIAVHGSNFDLLYYCDHPGWAVPIDEPEFAARVDSAIAQGAHWLVIAHLAKVDANPTAKAYLDRLPLETSGSDYRIYRLNR
jgi:hypothetical protein